MQMRAGVRVGVRVGVGDKVPVAVRVGVYVAVAVYVGVRHGLRGVQWRCGGCCAREVQVNSSRPTNKTISNAMRFKLTSPIDCGYCSEFCDA